MSHIKIVISPLVEIVTRVSPILIFSSSLHQPNALFKRWCTSLQLRQTWNDVIATLHLIQTSRAPVDLWMSTPHILYLIHDHSHCPFRKSSAMHRSYTLDVRCRRVAAFSDGKVVLSVSRLANYLLDARHASR